MSSHPSFASFGLQPRLISVCKSLGFHHPTLTQAEIIPAALRGDNLWAVAPTGSGKTLSYLLPILDGLLKQPKGRRLRALILTPTRECSVQTGRVVAQLCAHLPIRHQMLIGGGQKAKQKYHCRRGCNITIATPGRLQEFIEHQHIRLTGLEWLVLDEADRLFDAEYGQCLRALASTIPPATQILNLSASGFDHPSVFLQPQKPYRLLDIYLNQPSIEQHSRVITESGKQTALRECLQERDPGQAIIFTKSKQAAECVHHHLIESGFNSARLHSDMSQGQRRQTLQDMHQGRTAILVSTDLAARGLDFANLNCVINYDLPSNPKTYQHRLGRTGRGGQTGRAISLIEADEQRNYQQLSAGFRKRTLL